MADLTPVERGVLVALMASGGSLKENAELSARFQIKMTPAHRKKLAGLGLIRTSKKPFAHTLTDEGWAFMADGFPMDIPRDGMKLGALNALLAGVRERAGPDADAIRAFFSGKAAKTKAPAKAEEKKPSTPPTPPSGDADLSDAAWSDSEEALAMALQDIAAFGARMTALERLIDDSQKNAAKQLALNADSIFQNIRQAARKRGLETVFERGEEVDFDAVHFDCFEEIDEGEPAIVLKQPVVKHTARDQTLIVLRGLVSPAD